MELLELVVGAAVMCENKTTFIHNIFGLNHNSQTVLKGLLEHAMQSMVDYDGEGTADFDRLNSDFSESIATDAYPLSLNGETVSINANEEGSMDRDRVEGDPSEELIKSREMVRHLEAERDTLQREVAAAVLIRTESEKDRMVNGGESGVKDAAATASLNINLQMLLDDSKRELNLLRLKQTG